MNALVKFVKKKLGKMAKKGFKYCKILVPVDERTVIFISFHGKGYSDSPKAIYEEMLKDERFSDFNFIWAIKHAKKKGIEVPGAKVINYFSIPYFYYMAKAKFWVINCKMPMYISKKENQIYLQTWHGTPLKRLGNDIEAAEGATFYRSGVSFESMARSYAVDSARYNYMISPNEFSTKVFQSAFLVDAEKMIETGYPRNDFIVNADESICRMIKKKYGIPEDKKIVLYAPTWRDNSFDMSGYVFELEADFFKWKEILEEEYVLIFKPHYLIVNKYTNVSGLEGFLYNIPAEADINELYVISDMLVTDYSSVFFDYSVLGRPIYFYMYDLDSYKDELRGFYLDIYKDLPGKIYEKEEDVLEAIKKEEFDYTCLKVFNDRFNKFHTGDCSKKVLDILAKHI